MVTWSKSAKALSNEVWSDIHQDLIPDAQGKLKKVINVEAVKTSIDNILRTARGERVMLRSFGSDLKSLLFENINESMTSLVADEIKRAINTWDNRIVVNSVNFETDVDRNQVNVTLNFAILGFSEIFSFETVV